MQSAGLVLGRGKFLAINYLNCPGFSDTPEEAAALTAFLNRYPVNLIQWRNLNFDPLRYIQVMTRVSPAGEPLGVKSVLRRVQEEFPAVRHGYFNPHIQSLRDSIIKTHSTLL